MHSGLHCWIEGLLLGSNCAAVALCDFYNKLILLAQNLYFCVGWKCILKVIFGSTNLAYPEVNVACLCEALLHIQYAGESSSSSSEVVFLPT